MIRVTTGDLYPEQREVTIEPVFFGQTVRKRRLLRTTPNFEREFWRAIALMAHAQLSKIVEMSEVSFGYEKFKIPNSEWSRILNNFWLCKNAIIPLMSAKEPKMIQNVLVAAADEFQHLPKETIGSMELKSFIAKIEDFADDNNMSFLATIGNDMYTKNSIF